MRQDDLSTLTTSSPPSAQARPKVQSRVRGWIWPAGLALLVATTALAVAYFGSVWLVPVYLVLMVLILDVPGGKRGSAPASMNVPREDDGTDPRLSSVGVMESTFVLDPAAGLDRSAMSTALACTAALEFDPDSGVESATSPSKSSKKGRTRARKAKGTAVSQEMPDPSAQAPYTLATWVRVGPGKFVRSDAAANLLEVGTASVNPDPSLTRETEPVPEPAFAPDAGDVGSETEGEAADFAESKEDFARRFEATSQATEVFDEVSTGDNGIAPEAPEEPVSDFPDRLVEPKDDAPEPPQTRETEPAAIAVTEPGPVAPPEPSATCQESLTDEVGDTRSGVDRPSRRGSMRTLPGSWRGTSRSLVPAFATSVGASRVLPGNVRSIHPARVQSGRCRSPRRGRGTGRSRPVNRTHPPRSPPPRATTRERRLVLKSAPSR